MAAVMTMSARQAVVSFLNEMTGHIHRIRPSESDFKTNEFFVRVAGAAQRLSDLSGKRLGNANLQLLDCVGRSFHLQLHPSIGEISYVPSHG